VVRLKAQAAPFRPVYHLGEQVQALERASGGFWRLTTSKGTVLQAKAVIIAAASAPSGPTAAARRIEAFEGKSVFYYVTQRENFRGKRVVIAGGGDTAVDWALSLSEIAARVSVVHRRDKFRAAPKARPSSSAGQGGQGRHGGAVSASGPRRRQWAVEVGDRRHARWRGEEDRGRRAAAVLRAVDVAGPIADWSLALERNQIVTDPATAATSKPGISRSATWCIIPAS